MTEAEIKARIEKAIRKTERQIEEYREQSAPVAPDDAIGRVSRMDAINNKSVIEASLRQAESKLSNLQRVYSQIGTDDFGKCIQCGDTIPVERILFRPESLNCVKCAR